MYFILFYYILITAFFGFKIWDNNNQLAYILACEICIYVPDDGRWQGPKHVALLIYTIQSYFFVLIPVPVYYLLFAI